MGEGTKEGGRICRSCGGGPDWPCCRGERERGGGGIRIG